MSDIIVDINQLPKPSVKITPVTMRDLDYGYAVASEKEGKAKVYEYDTRIEAVRSRAKMVKLFKAQDYIVTQ